MQADVNGERDGRGPGPRAPAAGEAGSEAPAGGTVTLVHMALASEVVTILRAGVRAGAIGPHGAAGVWCQPALGTYALPEAQRLELRRGGHRTVLAVHARVPADLAVLIVGVQGQTVWAHAHEVADLIGGQPDPHAWRVFVPRSISRREIHLVRHVPYLVGRPGAPIPRDPAQRPHPRSGRRRPDPSQRALAKPQLLARLVGSIDPGDAEDPPAAAGPAGRGDG